MENYQNLLEKYIYSEVEIEQLEELYKTHQKEQKISNFNYEKNSELIDALIKAEMNIESLYKYCGVNKYTLENLEKEHIFLAPPEILNDKFELNTFVDTNNPEYIADYTNFVNKVLSTKPNTSTFALFQDWSFTENQYKGGAYIGSLTQDKFSDLMWGNYADKNSGLMIEYDFSELLEKIYPKDKVTHNTTLQLNKVIYSKRRPSGLTHHLLIDTYYKIKDCYENHHQLYMHYWSKDRKACIFLNSFKAFANLENFKFILCKDLSWQMEEEWRITQVDIENDNEKHYLSARAKAIYLGLDWEINYDDKYNEKYENKDKKKYATKILEYCKNSNIKVYKMVKDSTNRHKYIYEEHKLQKIIHY